jgi:hypothetical protein
MIILRIASSDARAEDPSVADASLAPRGHGKIAQMVDWVKSFRCLHADRMHRNIHVGSRPRPREWPFDCRQPDIGNFGRIHSGEAAEQTRRVGCSRPASGGVGP